MILEVVGLVMRFPDGFSVGPVDLSLPAGVWHLRGGNGAGKTTLLKALCGELRPTSGTIRILGQDPVADPLARRHLALLPARPDLPAWLRVDEAWQGLAALRGAPSWDGRALRESLGIPGDLLLAHASDGQRRRAELVAALAGDPAVLLLDEPFANLDVAAVGLFTALIERLRGTRAILVTGHQRLPFAVDGAATLERGSPLRLQGGPR